MGLEKEKADTKIFMDDDEGFNRSSSPTLSDAEKSLEKAPDRDPHGLNSHLKVRGWGGLYLSPLRLFRAGGSSSEPLKCLCHLRPFQLGACPPPPTHPLFPPWELKLTGKLYNPSFLPGVSFGEWLVLIALKWLV